MKRLSIAVFAMMFTFVGCGTYSARQIPLTEPRNQSYCERIEDMAVGIEPYMAKEKTILVFDNSLACEQVMALSISMIADGSTDYIVRKDGITAIDEFGNEYTPIGAHAVSERIDRALRKDEGLEADLAGREMPEEVTVTGELSQHVLYYDMMPNSAEARRFTIYIPATSTDGSVQKSFSLTVDPMRGHMNPTERWGSYDERGVTMTCLKTAKMEPAPAAAPVPAMTDDTERMEKAAEKQERIFEKSLMK